MIFALILLALLMLSLFVNLGQLTSSVVKVSGGRTRSRAHMAGPQLIEAVLEDNSARNKIAVVDIDGIITSTALDRSGFTMVDLIKAQLDLAQDDDRVKAVILKVDSPGGEVLASDEIYQAIKRFQDGKPGHPGKPVIASMGNLAASGGYYVSAPCRWIVANELTITGSIGVIMHTWNYRALMNKVGLEPEVYKSGRFKDMLSGSRDKTKIPPEDLAKERAMVDSLITEVYGKFTNIVAQGRSAAFQKNKAGSDPGKALANDWASYADGRVLSGAEARKLGFVDELGNFDQAVERAKIIGGTSSANLVKYEQHYDLGDFFRIFGATESRTLKVDLGMDMPKLEAGRLYFILPTVIP
jgi:protease IV